MIWEQGCVVIVMLTRLQDNGYQLCHRYWPEEGSEQYHIFEVRTSIMCDVFVTLTEALFLLSLAMPYVLKKASLFRDFGRTAML